MSGRTTGPFFKNGVDVYETSSGVQWMFTIFYTLFAIAFFIYLGVAVNSYAVRHDYFYNPGMPGTLVTERYNFLWVMLCLSIIACGMFLIILPFMVVFRDSYGCHMFWFLIYFLFFALGVFALVVLGIQYGSCNDATEPHNICNDRRWCCVYYADPANLCPNHLTGPCPGVTAADLGPNPEFLWMFWTLFAQVLLQLIYFIVIIVYWFSTTARSAVVEEEGTSLPPKEKEEAEPVSARAYLTKDPEVASWITGKQPYGLRKRK